MFGFKSLRDEKVFWNTGRTYTEHGQRMGAFWDGTHIHYVDVDRMITGSFRCSRVSSECDLKEYVQVVYDRPIGHRHTILSFEDRDALELETELKAPSLKKEDS